jgi:hypothetical protein
MRARGEDSVFFSLFNRVDKSVDVYKQATNVIMMKKLEKVTFFFFWFFIVLFSNKK